MKESTKSSSTQLAPSLKKPVQFDSDLSVKSQHNKLAAKTQNLRYDPRKRAYVDADGSLIADRFGQRY